MAEILTINDVTKVYRLGTIGYGSLKKDLQSYFARLFRREDPNSKLDGRLQGGVFKALDGVSMTADEGEAVGIIGRNGAGKSTLLKLISRITAPTCGEIRYRGRIASMLEVGTGFHPELTGRENIYLNGAILGMKKSEIRAKEERIIEFSECGDFIDTPVKRYSKGMTVRLAFSVAAHLDGEIMLMDEVLAVGDAAFKDKCRAKMRSAALDEGRTVLCVSHNMDTIRAICSRCIVLDEGKKVFDGPVDAAVTLYQTICASTAK